MSEYYEVDVDGDGRVDAVEVTEFEDGSAVVLVDVDGDGYADYEYDVPPSGEVDGSYEAGGSDDASADDPTQPSSDGPVDPAIEAIDVASRARSAVMWSES